MERNASDAPIWTATSLTEAAFGLAAKGQFLEVSVQTCVSSTP